MSAQSVAPVTVAIACYNQGRFLGEALRSLAAQDLQPAQIVVVDDGSTDETQSVVAQHPSVEYIYQPNRGLSGARNTGWRAARYPAIIFLDADDRLLPSAVAVGWESLQRHPTVAYVAGHYEFMDEAGARLPIWREMHRGNETEFHHGHFQYFDEQGRAGMLWPRRQLTTNHYAAMLRRNYIGMHAAVMYRREVFAQLGGFDESLRCCEDYDMYLRITRACPVACHEEVVAEYRRHAQGMSRGTQRMLRTVLQILDAQTPHLLTPSLQQARQAGYRFWRRYFAKQLSKDMAAHLSRGEWRSAGQSAYGVAEAVGWFRNSKP